MLPIMLDVVTMKILVVGAGKIATRKIQKLVAAGNSPTVIAPVASDYVQKAAVAKKITWHKRIYQIGDTADFQMIFICTNDDRVNHEITRDILPTQLVNDTTNKANSNFFNLASFAYHDFEIALSSKGKSPSQTKELKEKLQQILRNEDSLNN